MDINETVNETGITDESGDTGADGNENAKKYTENEIAKLVQSETDRRLSQAQPNIYAKAKADLEQELQAVKLQNEKDNLISQHKYKEHNNILQAELDAIKAEKAQSEKITTLSKVLAEKGLGEYLDIFSNDASPVEDIIAKIEKFEALNKSKVTDQVMTKLDNPPPKSNGGNNDVQNWWDLPLEQYEAAKKVKGIY